MARTVANETDSIVQDLKLIRRPTNKKSTIVSKILTPLAFNDVEAKAVLIHLAKTVLDKSEDVDIVLNSWDLLTGFEKYKGIGERRSVYKEKTGYKATTDNLSNDEEKSYLNIAEYCAAILKDSAAKEQFVKDALTKYIVDGAVVLQTPSYEQTVSKEAQPEPEEVAISDSVSGDAVPEKLDPPPTVVEESKPKKVKTAAPVSEKTKTEKTTSTAPVPKKTKPKPAQKSGQQKKKERKPHNLTSTLLWMLIPVVVVSLILIAALISSNQTEDQTDPTYGSSLTTTDDLLAIFERDIERAGIKSDFLSRIEEQANNGSAEDQYRLGMIYYSEGDFEKASTYLSLAAEQGIVHAKTGLAILHILNRVSNPDYDLVFSIANETAETGDDVGQFLLGRCFLLGIGTKADSKEAARWYQLAADQGNPVAKCDLGTLYLLGVGVDQDVAHAQQLLKDAYSDGYPAAAYFIGHIYRDGLGNISRNIPLAMEWYRKAADEGGYAEACVALGYYYFVGADGVEQDYKEAYKWYKKAADQNNPEAQFCLSSIYIRGLDIAQNDSEGIYWLKRSAENGFAEAQKQLAHYYFSGEHVEQNYELGFEWLRRAADQGDEEAQEYLNRIVN